MERLGLGDWLLEPQRGVIEGFAVRTKTARFVEALPPGPRASRGYIVRRPEFEPKIQERLRAAGVTVHDGVGATRLVRSPAGEVLGVEAREVASGEALRFEAPLVVAAGGWNGFEDASESGKPGMIVSRQYCAGTPDPGWAGRRYLHVWYTAEISALGMGYGRIFYLGDGSANVGVAVYGRNLPDDPPAREAAIERLHEGFLEEPEVAAMLSSATPEGPVKHRIFRAGGLGFPRHAQGLLHVGDAAGTSHPVSGEGIGFALEAGRLAAGWAHEAYRRRDFSAALLSGYSRQVRRLRSVRHASTHALAALDTLLLRLDLMEPVFKACETDAGLRRTLAECLGPATRTRASYCRGTRP